MAAAEERPTKNLKPAPCAAENRFQAPRNLTSVTREKSSGVISLKRPSLRTPAP